MLIKISIEDPLPKLSSVINSANHIESKDPVVKETIIFNASCKFQLKTTGLIKKNAMALLNIIAQTNVKYLV